MAQKSGDCRRAIRLPVDLDAEVERYARANGMNFSEAVRDLCDRALAKDFDRQYAPRINEVTKQVGDSVVDRVEVAVLHAVDEVLAEIRISEVRRVVGDARRDDPNLSTSAASVFLPERYEDEKEFVWPL